jgi:hypothetical protein
VLVARKVTSMKVITAVIAAAEGAEVNVSATCQMAGVSRKTFYKWLARYRAEGLAGLEERSRQPRRVPHRVDPVIEDAVVRWRKQLLEEGLDHGPTTIQWHLGRDADLAGRVPSVATIYRILARRGQITAQPTKRPRASWCRFEAPAPNEWWQIDATDWVTAHGVVRIFNIIDDHSRLAVRSRAVTEATGAHAWTTFCQAAATWGLPAGVLSDNGLSRVDCAASKCSLNATCATSACGPSPAAPTTPRPPARLNASNKPSNAGCAVNPSLRT